MRTCLLSFSKQHVLFMRLANASHLLDCYPYSTDDFMTQRPRTPFNRAVPTLYYFNSHTSHISLTY